jgi:hypothetical protein
MIRKHVTSLPEINKLRKSVERIEKLLKDMIKNDTNRVQQTK